MGRSRELARRANNAVWVFIFMILLPYFLAILEDAMQTLQEVLRVSVISERGVKIFTELTIGSAEWRGRGVECERIYSRGERRR